MTPRFDPSRLWDSLMQMARIGARPDGGVNRLALTPEDGAARALLRDWAIAAGCTLSVDRLGSMVLTYAGADPSLPAVAVGSHLDSVPTGGKYDGAYGVLAGLEIVRALHAAGARAKAPIAIVNWTNEEGARFAPPMAASEVAMGFAPEDRLLATPDRFGETTFAAALAECGWQGAEDPAAARRFGAYFEAHIEQGPVLEREGIPLGIVTHGYGVAYCTITVTGRDGHIGGAMADRRDALLGAAEVILTLESIALGTAGRGLASATRLALSPDARGNIPSEVRLVASLRNIEQDGLDGMRATLAAACEEIARRREQPITIEYVSGYPSVRFDPMLLQRLRDAAAAAGLAHRDLPTPIGHDALHVGRVVPSAMLFIPCHGGLSHNPAESITPEWSAAGLAALAPAVIETAGGLA
ncbi:hydantoinase/carbamoylase family amidase [Roseomonas sp. PWR1]|uniref:Hydantoinase/carbamoylase family amidase n=1 Tax=Roseomonas nitratireducens TaxID=2820810 RepID=A0ABS4AXP0_9PROT|nr:hydantoinase/carbamoylase family amidase [Neoroseomonas nitratireducens]MBP0466019.1 hydantoinase/carbamoylase family amidase [Neoroseomonas nitratireducens]